MDPNADIRITANSTDIQASLATLRQLGRSADAETLLNQAADNIQPVVAGIEADPGRTDQWRRQQEAKAYGRALASLAVSLRRAATTASNTDNDDAARVFGIKGLAGDVASLIIARRDAADRVADITDPVSVWSLANATRSSDETLAHALVEQASNRATSPRSTRSSPTARPWPTQPSGSGTQRTPESSTPHRWSPPCRSQPSNRPG